MGLEPTSCFVEALRHGSTLPLDAAAVGHARRRLDWSNGAAMSAVAYKPGLTESAPLRRRANLESPTAWAGFRESGPLMVTRCRDEMSPFGFPGPCPSHRLHPLHVVPSQLLPAEDGNGSENGEYPRMARSEKSDADSASSSLWMQGRRRQTRRGIIIQSG